jgi:glutaredoxin
MEYEEAVRDQKKELREAKKREKLQEEQSQLPQIELTSALDEPEPVEA